MKSACFSLTEDGVDYLKRLLVFQNEKLLKRLQLYWEKRDFGPHELTPI